ncbi:unnamed protein product [Didymodactylos carnosus]|nr:unnamed protein product [Didymodactylos carnosus]
MPMSICNVHVEAKNKSIRDLSKENCTFFWFQLLIETLLRMPQTSSAKSDLLDLCRQHYDGNDEELSKINEFERCYCCEQAIWWYTRDSFLYRQLNKAFRTENIDIIFKFRFFIIDLNKQLYAMHNNYLELLRTYFNKLTVYRGQAIPTEELERLKYNIGGFISMNTFLSTTTDREIALIYAGNGSDRPTHESVLFEITIDLNALSTDKPFVNIKDLRYFNGTIQQTAFR